MPSYVLSGLSWRINKNSLWDELNIRKRGWFVKIGPLKAILINFEIFIFFGRKEYYMD
jgi:hypothetical protein